MEKIDHYRAYKPDAFKREERNAVTILFGGLHWRAERLIQGAMNRLGYKTRVLPPATRDDLLTGRSVADIGQCSPTSFTTGNLANFLKAQVSKSSADEVKSKYVYFTAGSCGACRFGQYHQSYELALKNIGLEKFRMFLLNQDDLDQGEQNGGGLDLNVAFTMGVIWAVILSDLVQDLEYRTRPYEVNEGETDQVTRESIEFLYERLCHAPVAGGNGWRSGIWHLTTRYFVNALGEVRRRFADIEVDRLQVKPIVKITGEFYLQTVEGEPNYNIHRWLENEGAEVYPAPITVWLDYLLRLSAQEYKDHHGLVKGARLKSSMLLLTQKLLNWTYRRFRHALGDVPHSLPSQDELRKLAAPYYHSRMSGGEGDMLIGKALWAHRHQKAHMICELSPYGCMPNTMSVGAMASVLGNHPDLLYAPLEIKGDAEVHALSRCQMILTEAKRRAQDEFDEVIAETNISTGQARQILHKTPHRLLADWPVPDMGVTGIAANLVLYLSGQKVHERLVRASPKKTVAANPVDIPIEVRPAEER